MIFLRLRDNCEFETTNNGWFPGMSEVGWGEGQGGGTTPLNFCPYVTTAFRNPWFLSIKLIKSSLYAGASSAIYVRNFCPWLENRFGPGERGDWNFFLGHFYWPFLTDWLIFIVVSRSSIKPWDFFQRSPSLSRPLRVYDLMGLAKDIFRYGRNSWFWLLQLICICICFFLTSSFIPTFTAIREMRVANSRIMPYSENCCKRPKSVKFVKKCRCLSNLITTV